MDHSCDTLVATSSATKDGSVIFAKNSDRHRDECQHFRIYPAREWAKDVRVSCQYVTLPQARHTYRVLGGQPFWLWGFEHGVNEHAVAIGNAAIWTKASRSTVGLLGMDLIRLGLERGATAQESLECMTRLLAEYGPGGSPRHYDPAAECYDNSFIIADPIEAWVLETSGRDWVARRVEGAYSISNVACTDSEFEIASDTIRDRPGFDFARELTDFENHPPISGQTRCARSRLLLQQHTGRIDVASMMEFLRDHGPDPEWQPGTNNKPTICVHPGDGITAASLICCLRKDTLIAWCSLVTPCISVFLPVFMDVELPGCLASGCDSFSEDSPWWRIRRILETATHSWPRAYPHIRGCRCEWEARLLADATKYEQASYKDRSLWVHENFEQLEFYLEELEIEFDLHKSATSYPFQALRL